ncbi:MAG: S9 family peptidase, partial [Bacteroidales bacterium]|nr:S9 family peptidase [Bacteroidales bacterium]
MRKTTILTLFFVTFFSTAFTQNFAQNIDLLEENLKHLQTNDENLNHRLDVVEKMIDDLLWYQKVGDIAHVDKLYIYGPPKWKEENPTAKGAGNPVKFWTYVFIPKDVDVSKKYPLIVLPHGGVHADFTT